MNNNETNKLLREILKWQRLREREILKKKIKEEKLFTESEDIIIYYHSDGERSSRDLGKIAKVSHTKVQGLWKKWMNAEIATPAEKYKGSVDAEDYLN